MKGLLLLGHGSKIPGFNDVMEFHKKRISKIGIFDEIAIAYVSISPGLKEIINEMKSDEIYIVPLFMSHGAHTKELPSLLGLNSNSGEYNGVKVTICNPIGNDELITYAILNSVIESEENRREGNFNENLRT